jgi:hypothetical protein
MARSLFETASANISLHPPAKVTPIKPKRGPLLLAMGGEEHTVPER